MYFQGRNVEACQRFHFYFHSGSHEHLYYVPVTSEVTMHSHTRGETTTVDRSDAHDRWRYCCPRGHTAFKPSGDGIWCRTCERDGKRPRYTRLLDKYRGALIAIEPVEFVSD